MEQNTKLTFENAISRLEEIVSLLSDGNAPLDNSLTLFEEGVGLVKFCSSKLDEADKKVKILTKGEDGRPALADFTPEN